MRTLVLLPAALLLSLALLAPAAQAGIVRSAACAPLPSSGNSVVDGLLDAAGTFSCSVGGIAGGVVVGLACIPLGPGFSGPVRTLLEATGAFTCAIGTVLV